MHLHGARLGMRLARLAGCCWCLAWSAPLPAGDFEFVVIGDTRPRFESENFHVFEGLIARINAAHPAFVINLGDLIFGYGPRGKERQWDGYQRVVRALAPPYFQLPGNHDVHSKEARRIYGRRFGKFYDSFDHDDVHFVLLDNCEAGRWGNLGPTQFAWLRRDLAGTRARSVFVYMHFPVWEQERVAPAAHEFWARSLHPLFKQARVRAVFAGHFHSYGPTREWDGIRYFISGGGGAELRPDYRRSGGQYHFLKVKVAGDRFDLRVVTQNGELTDAEADIMGGFIFADRHSSRMGVPLAAEALNAGVTCSVALNNPYAEALTGRVEWTLDTNLFAVSPASATVRIPPAGKQDFEFRLWALKDSVALDSAPRLQFEVTGAGQRHRFHREVLFLQTLRTAYRRAPLTLDGRLEDWENHPPLRLAEAAKPEARLRALHDGRNLYLALSLPAVTPTPNEESAFRDDLQLGLAAGLRQTEFGGDVLRLGFKATGGGLEVRDRTPGGKLGVAVPAVRGACQTTAAGRTYELSVPLALLKSSPSRSEKRLILNLSFPAPEEGAGENPTTQPGLNSFAYQVRYGEDSLVPVYFAELRLERTPP